MLQKVYSKTLSWAQHPNALWILAFISFLESSIFPIPPDLLMIPMIIAAPHRAFYIAAICTASSVLGGLFGYAIGYLAYETIAEPVLIFYGKEAYFNDFATQYASYGAWAVLIAGITPFPYKVITILSGATQLNIFVFFASSIAARGLRFFMVAFILYKWGPQARTFIEKRLGLMFTLFIVLLIGGFALI